MDQQQIDLNGNMYYLPDDGQQNAEISQSTYVQSSNSDPYAGLASMQYASNAYSTALPMTSPSGFFPAITQMQNPSTAYAAQYMMTATQTPMPSAQIPMPAAQAPMPAAQPLMPDSQTLMPFAQTSIPTAQLQTPIAQIPAPAVQPQMPFPQVPAPAVQPQMPYAQFPMPVAQMPRPDIPIPFASPSFCVDGMMPAQVVPNPYQMHYRPDIEQAASEPYETYPNPVADHSTTYEPESHKPRSHKTVKRVLASVGTLVVLLAVIALLIPPSTLVDIGLYDVAYAKASDNQKDEVLQAILAKNEFSRAYAIVPEEKKDEVLLCNALSNLAAKTADGLKDPTSFLLREAWFEPKTAAMVLHVSGSNSFGAKVSNLYLYVVNDSTGEYDYIESVADLEFEDFSKYDDYDDMLKKFVGNISKLMIATIMSGNDTKIDDLYVDVVNDLFENDSLKKVNLMPEAKNLCKSTKDSSV